MSKFTLEVNAFKEVPESGPYSYNSTKYITGQELYEAVSKYLAVKGYETTVVSVEETKE